MSDTEAKTEAAPVMIPTTAAKLKAAAKKPRKRPAKAKTEAEVTTPAAHSITQEGATITCQGSDVKVALAPEQLKGFGIKKVAGKVPGKCKEPVVITFTNAKKARAFFDMCFVADDENQPITSGSKADWFGEELNLR